MKKISVLIILAGFLIGNVFANELSGKGWLFEDGIGGKKIILFEKDNTFTYLNIVSKDNEGNLYSQDSHTYFIEGDKVFISYTDGYRLCSLTLNGKNNMYGVCINKKGMKDEVTGVLIR